MIKSVLLDYIENAGVETGNLKAFYDLSGSVDSINVSDRDSFYKLTSGATKTLDTYVVYNQLTETGNQLKRDLENNPLISTESFPAVVASSSDSITGSGHFDGKCSLRVANSKLKDSWTCFFDFSGYDIDADTFGLNQVLLSTMKSENSLSGFNFGINGSNRLYYEYISGGENTYYDEEGESKELNVSPSFQRETKALTDHLKNLNIASLSKSKNGVEFSLHKPNEPTVSFSTLTPEFSGSNDLIIGGMSPEATYKGYYTGFSGYVNTFLLFGDYMPQVTRDVIAESFWTESYTREILETGESTHKQVTGAEVQNVLSGQGIVSYSMEEAGSYVNEAGQTVPLYGNNPVLGDVYQDVLVDLTSDVDVKSITGKYIPEESIRKSAYVNSTERIAGKITFTNKLQEGEIYEIYNHDSFNNSLANKAEVLGGKLNLQSFGSFEPANSLVDNPDRPAAGEKFFAKIKSDNFSYRPTSLQPYFQLFHNGLYQQEVSGLYTVDSIFYLYNVLKDDDITSAYDGQYLIHDPEAGVEGDKYATNRIKNNQYYIALNHKQSTWDDENDNLIFDLASGAAITGEYDGLAKQFGEDYIGKDIYYNGQKLISGVHFEAATQDGEPVMVARPSKLGGDQGEESIAVPIGSKFIFVPPASNYYTRETGIVRGAGATLESVSVDNIFFEQVWVNGKRLIPGVDYFKSPSNTLLTKADSPTQQNKSFVMDYEPNSIDVKVLSEIENKNDKVFSLDSVNQKRNLFQKV